MRQQPDNLPIMSFASASALRQWLHEHHATSDGIWVRIGKKPSGVASLTFSELLDAGLCFGWSESTRRAGDAQSYLQRFTPRRTQGTKSRRNQERVQRLIEEGKMRPPGLKALGMRADVGCREHDPPVGASEHGGHPPRGKAHEMYGALAAENRRP